MRRIGALLIAGWVWCVPTLAGTVLPTLINGARADVAQWKQVVLFSLGTRTCTGTIVGPRTVVSAAHCFKNGETVNFDANSKTYSGTVVQHTLYPGKDIDLAIVYTNEDLAGVTPQKIGGVADLNKEVTVLGYGCKQFPAPAVPENILWIGKTQTIGYSGYKVATRLAGGVALCFGDDGGPTLLNNLLVAVSSLGNKTDTNYHTRLDRSEATDFLKETAQAKGLVICGVNSDCGGTPPPQAPSCVLTANPNAVKVNDSVSLVLNSTNAVAASIDGTAVNVPNGEKRLTATAIGNFVATATVLNSQGATATCQATYSVSQDPIPNPTRPTCTLTAIPSTAKIGETITLEINVTGTPTYASIDGNSVGFPVGRLNISKAAKGDYSATGFVRSASGSANCFASYSVQDGTVPPPLAEFSLTTTHCGNNQYPESGVRSACIAFVKKDASWTDVKVSQALLLTYTDNSQEVLPLLAKSTAGTREDWIVYSNLLVKGAKFPILDSRKATVTKLNPGDIPTALEGRSAKNRYFLAPSLTAFHTRSFLPALKTKETK